MPQNHPGIRKNWYFGDGFNCDDTTDSVYGQDKIQFQLLYIPSDLTINRIGLEITVPCTEYDQQSAGSKARLGLYTNDYTNAVPKDLILDAGEVPIDSTGWKEITVNSNLVPGWHWIAMVAQAQAGYRGKGPSEIDQYVTGAPYPQAPAFALETGYSYSPLPTAISENNIGYIEGTTVFLHVRRV